jgi:hypothetical protein
MNRRAFVSGLMASVALPPRVLLGTFGFSRRRYTTEEQEIIDFVRKTSPGAVMTESWIEHCLNQARVIGELQDGKPVGWC